MGFRAMRDQIRTGTVQLRAERDPEAAAIGFIDGTEKMNPGRMYSTNQVIRLIGLIWLEIE